MATNPSTGTIPVQLPTQKSISVVIRASSQNTWQRTILRWDNDDSETFTTQGQPPYQNSTYGTETHDSGETGVVQVTVDHALSAEGPWNSSAVRKLSTNPGDVEVEAEDGDPHHGAVAWDDSKIIFSWT